MSSVANGYDIPLLGGVIRGVSGLVHPDGSDPVPNQPNEMQAGATQGIYANAALGGAINQYKPGQNNQGAQNAMNQAGGAADNVGRMAGAQNTASDPGLNAQRSNLSYLQGMAQNGDQASLRQFDQGNRQAMAMQGAQGRSVGGLSPAQQAAMSGQGNAQQAQVNGANRQMLQAQGQMAGQSLYGSAASNYGTSVNNAYGAAQNGQASAADARQNNLNTNASFQNGQQANNQDYLNTVGAIGNQAYNNSINYANTQKQAGASVVQGASSAVGAAF